MEKQHLKLTKSDQEYLENLISKGSLKAKEFNRSLGLLELNKNKPFTEVSKLVNKSTLTISTWAKKYKESGLDFLKDKPRKGRPIEIDSIICSKITALACTDAPAGYAKWTVRLLAAKAVELDYCDEISKSKVGDILKKMNSSPI